MTATRNNAESSKLNVVAIGGGTGLSTLLRGLKQHVAREGDPEEPGPEIECLTAVVTVSDDGGSSGRLRQDFGVTPPGDIRNCMTALSDDEALLSKLFQFRFSSGQGLQGHNFGNLFLVALAEVTGDFTEAVKLSSAILKTRGDIFPATTANVTLLAMMDDGTCVRGETNITASDRRIVELKLVPADAQPLPQTLKAIEEADLITIGPGSLFTSLVPNLLVHGIPEAIAASTAAKVYVCNLMTQANESLDLTASQHVKALFEHGRGMKLFDFALLNETPVPEAMREKYAASNAAPIVNDLEALMEMGVTPIVGHYLDDCPIARHNARLIACDLLELAVSERRKTQGTMMVDAIRK
jgi:uncharacterized cofD-like protein